MGTLAGILEKPPVPLTWFTHKLPMAVDVARAMAYLHSFTPPIIHRDLKPENVLIDAMFRAKLADFGTSKEEKLNQTMTYAGTPIYMSPEQHRDAIYDHSIDVWAYGCVLECLCTHRQVYSKWSDDGKTLPWLKQMLMRNQMAPEAPDGHFLGVLISRCTEFEFDQRLTFREVLYHLELLHFDAARMDELEVLLLRDDALDDGRYDDDDDDDGPAPAVFRRSSSSEAVAPAGEPPLSSKAAGKRPSMLSGREDPAPSAAADERQTATRGGKSTVRFAEKEGGAEPSSSAGGEAKKLEEMLAAMAKEQEAEEAGPSEPDIEAGRTLSPFLKFRV